MPLAFCQNSDYFPSHNIKYVTPSPFILVYKVKHNFICARGLLVTCFILIAVLIVYGREIFIYLDLTLLRMGNILFDIQVQDYEEN